MKNYEPKLPFAESFIDLVEVMPIDKITVGMIVDGVGRHRKTFYYHFSDKDELIRWLFRYDLAKGLEEDFPRDVLVREGRDGSYPDLPFYVRRATCSGHIYNAAFFEAFARALEHRRDYYRRVFSPRGLGTLEDYLYRLYCPEIREDISCIVDAMLADEPPLLQAPIRERLTQGASVDFLAEFFTGAFIQRYIKRLLDDDARRTIEDIRPYENVIHDSLTLLIGADKERAVAEGSHAELLDRL